MTPRLSSLRDTGCVGLTHARMDLTHPVFCEQPGCNVMGEHNYADDIFTLRRYWVLRL
jgi:hypothetical protein